MANKTKAELLAEAEAKGIEVPADATNKEIAELLKGTEPAETDAPAPVETEAPTPAQSEGSDIAAAIREGLSAGKEDKRIKITSDKHVQSMFSVVRSKRTGEIMLRENSTGVLSKVQLKSIEEKEADLQTEEVDAL